MEILIKPQKFTGSDSWESKLNGVILVEKEADIEPLWKLLCEQDDYWKIFKNVIKVVTQFKEKTGFQLFTNKKGWRV